MKKDPRYRPVGQLGDDDVISSDGGSYEDDPRLEPETGEHGMPVIEGQHQRNPLGNNPNRLDEHPVKRGSDLTNDIVVNNLRMRRIGGFSQEGSHEKEGLSSHLDEQSHRRNGSAPRPSRLGYDKNSNTEISSSPSSSEREDEDDDHSEGRGAARAGNESRGEDGSGLFSASHGSSFDLLDDEDEINLQRYHRNFGDSATLYDDVGWDDERMMIENSTNIYHPRTESNGSHSKDPWIRMVTQNDQQSPTNGRHMSLSAIHSVSDALLYLQGVRRQARQRRAQRLLTMPSEQWWERLQFCFMTYCWDSTDVGLLVVAIMLAVWFLGLLWLGRISARDKEASYARQSGAEYNGNAEFDGYEREGRSWRVMFQWWWWGLGVVLLVRILGPFAVQTLNNRRRERRRQRFMSGNMQEQQRRMQQQQLPTMGHSKNNGTGNPTPSGRHEVQSHVLPSPASQEDSLPGVEIAAVDSGLSNSPEVDGMALA